MFAWREAGATHAAAGHGGHSTRHPFVPTDLAKHGVDAAAVERSLLVLLCVRVVAVGPCSYSRSRWLARLL